MESVCRKDSTEIDEADRTRLIDALRAAAETRVVVTHGTDTMIETAQIVLRSGAAAGKVVVFTGAMKPERFKDSDAIFNVGMAVGATSILTAGSVAIAMGGGVVQADRCTRDLQSGQFLEVAAV